MLSLLQERLRWIRVFRVENGSEQGGAILLRLSLSRAQGTCTPPAVGFLQNVHFNYIRFRVQNSLSTVYTLSLNR